VLKKWDRHLTTSSFAAKSAGWFQSHFSTDCSVAGYPGSTLLGGSLKQRSYRESLGGGRDAKSKGWDSSGDFH
jgi:hypothetical protein